MSPDNCAVQRRYSDSAGAGTSDGAMTVKIDVNVELRS